MIRLLFLCGLFGLVHSTNFTITGIVGSNADAVRALEAHMKMFQSAIENGNKDILKKMLPVEQQNTTLLDNLILAHRSIKMEVVDAAYPNKESKEFITGMVNYSRDGGEKTKTNIIIQKAIDSPSGYKFVSVIHHADHKKNFPICLIGFIWCYLYLIEVLPGSVEELFG